MTPTALLAASIKSGSMLKFIQAHKNQADNVLPGSRTFLVKVIHEPMTNVMPTNILKTKSKVTLMLRVGT